MSPFEYMLPMVSILIGLAVGDLSLSLHRLLRARQRVRWDWLPMAAALLVLGLILDFWWAFYTMGEAEVWTRYWGFLILASSLICIFLLASASLPDAIPEEGLDLAAYYHENRGYFWVLFALFTVLSLLLDLLVETENPGAATVPFRIVPTLAFAALMLSLAFVESRRFHAVVVLLFLAFFGWQWSLLRIG